MSRHASAESPDPSAPPRLCQNCGAPLTGPYCSNCGQHDIDYHRSFHHLFEDLLENLFHFEGKFFVTVAWLLAKPGRLTKEFIAGRRQAQLNPLRFYIFVSVLFFLGLSLLNHGHLIDFNRSEVDSLQQDITGELQDSDDRPVQLTPEQAEDYSRRIRAAAQSGHVDASTIVEAIRQARAAVKPAVEAEAKPEDDHSADKPATPPAKKKQRGSRVHFDTKSELGRALEHKVNSGELTVSKVWDALEHRAPTLLFLGVPLFALLLKLFYIGSGRYYIEHLIFSLHLHTWAFLALMVGNGYLKIASLGPDWLSTLVGWAIFLWAVWYVLASFRAVYAQGWRKTTLKIALMVAAHSFLLLMVALTLAVGTLYWLVLE